MKKSISLILVLLLVSATDVTKADFTFGTPTNLGPTINSSYGEAVSSISADGLMLYFASDRPGYGGADIWVTKRQTIVDDWGTPENLGPPVNTSQDELFSCISTDGLELYFDAHNRPGGYGQGSYAYDIWMARRPTINSAWGIPINLGTPVNTSGVEGAPRLSNDGLELYFTDYNGGYGADDIWITRRATKNDPWEQPINLGAVVNSSASEDHPFLSTDSLALFFSEERGQPLHPLRSGGFGDVDMWVTTRSSTSEPWDTPVNLGPAVNSTSLDGAPVISPDGSTLYFSSERPGGFGGIWGDIYQAPIMPIVDFNGDGIVDSTDMCIMVDHWGEDYSLCDIGPMPWGDGIVDVEDLIVLAEHLFEDYRLVAHWALDEEMGNIVNDSIGEHYGTVQGEPLWQPTGGKINGALQFNGIDDCVTTDLVVNPSNSVLSVVAWIKGSAPGQVIMSQIGVANWLCTDAVEGFLTTELKDPGRLPEPVTLVDPVYTEDHNGVILSCEESENAVGYELLFGSDPYRVMDYEVISDTPTPPNHIQSIIPSDKTWWTVRVRDQHGSTIYADPISMVAYNPNPADDAVHPDTWATLSWNEGMMATSYDVYLGENFGDVQDGTAGVFRGNQTTTYFIVGFAGFPYPDGLVPGTTYFWRIDDVESDGTVIHKGKIWRFTVSL